MTREEWVDAMRDPCHWNMTTKQRKEIIALLEAAPPADMDAVRAEWEQMREWMRHHREEHPQEAWYSMRDYILNKIDARLNDSDDYGFVQIEVQKWTLDAAESLYAYFAGARSHAVRVIDLARIIAEHAPKETS